MIVAELEGSDMADLLAGVVIYVNSDAMGLRQLAEVNILANERLSSLGIDNLKPRLR
jgi:hypothetical protein